jgi:DNA-binding NarL/FixJ family response regulator
MHTPTPRTSRQNIRVFLFAEDRIVLESLKSLLNSNEDMIVSAEADSASIEQNSLSDLANSSDIAVVYLTDPNRAVIVDELMACNPTIRVVVAVDGLDIATQANVLKFGAVGIVQINQNAKFLVEAVRQTHKGETWLNQVLLHKILESGKTNGRRLSNGVATENTDLLTARELEVINMIGEGLSNKELAVRLSISEATVRHHLSSIYSKIGVEDRVNMVIRAHQKGLLTYSVQPLGTIAAIVGGLVSIVGPSHWL